MFEFLKEKLKRAVSKFTRDIDDEAEEIVEQPAEEEPARKEKPKKKKEEKKVRQKKEKEKPEPGIEEKEESIEREAAEEETEKTKITEEEATDTEELSEAAEQLTGSELIGLKETLETFSDEEINSLVSNLKISLSKKAGKNEKIAAIIKKPLVEVNSAIEELELVENVPEPEEEKEEPAEQIAEPGETEVLEEEEKKELEGSADSKETEESEEPEKTEEEPLQKKTGFFKRLFGFGKKEDKKEKEELLIEKEEPAFSAEDIEKEKEEEIVEEIEKEESVIEEEEEKEQEEEKDEELKGVDKELQEIDARKDSVEKKLEKDDADLDFLESGEKKGFFGKLAEGLTLKKLSEPKFDSIFFDLEVALLENNMAVEVIEKIKNDLKQKLVDRKIKRSDIESIVEQSLAESLTEILDIAPVDILAKVLEKRKQQKPFIMVFVGINGSGKTTTIAKVAKYLANNKLKSVMVASDTFRAAAIDQLEEHANNLGIKLIKHDYGSDPAAVAFDGIKYAESKNIDVVLIDTAGRLHSNTNLMDEMKKIIRIANPDMKIFVGESITGNDCVEQAKKFNEAIDIDGIILSKADVDEKGGAAISVSYVTGKAILFIGTGQTYDSLERFDKKMIMEHLGL